MENLVDNVIKLGGEEVVVELGRDNAIGLFQAKWIVKALGGKIWIEIPTHSQRAQSYTERPIS